MQAWLAGLRSEDVTGVLFTADTHVPTIYAASAEAEQFPPHCEKSTPGWENVLDPDAINPAVSLCRERLYQHVRLLGFASPARRVADHPPGGIAARDRDEILARLKH